MCPQCHEVPHHDNIKIHLLYCQSVYGKSQIEVAMFSPTSHSNCITGSGRIASPKKPFSSVVRNVFAEFVNVIKEKYIRFQYYVSVGSKATVIDGRV